MITRFTLALIGGRPVVIEQRPDLPPILHTFDSAKDAIAYYEQYRAEPLSPEARRIILQADGGREVVQ